MRINQLISNHSFTLLTNTPNDVIINNVVACDLLSHVMANADEGDVLITVLNNINVLGVASLLDLSLVIFSYNINVDDSIILKANELNIPLFKSNLTTAEVVYLLKEMDKTIE